MTKTQLPPLKRTDKQMSDADARALLARGYAGRLATIGRSGWPYIVPLLYVCLDDEIWLHNTRVRGHLRENVEHDARACFEMDEPGEIFPYGPIECDTNIAYRSIVAFGRIRVIEDRGQKQRFFAALMEKYRNPDWDRPRDSFPRLDQTTVYALAIEQLTGKETPLPPPEAQWSASGRAKPGPA